MDRPALGLLELSRLFCFMGDFVLQIASKKYRPQGLAFHVPDSWGGESLRAWKHD